MKYAFVVLALLLTSAPARGEDFSEQFEAIKREATPEEFYRFLYAVPKGGDLHNHLGGAAHAEILYRLATDRTLNGNQTFRTRVRMNECSAGCSNQLLYFHTVRESFWAELPECCRAEYEPLTELSAGQRAAWLDSVRLNEPGEGRNEFFETIWPRIGEVLDQAPILAEIAVENMKLFAAEGLRYVEFQISPFGRRLGDRALTEDEFHDVMVQRLSGDDAVASGVTVRFQTNVLRFHPEAESAVEASYAFVDRHRDLWSSVNLVGREDNDKGYPLRFLETFRKMRRQYPRIFLSIHGGEVDEPNRHVRDTLLLGAQRIGHGTNLITDPDTVLLMRSGRFPIEISLVSNHLLDYAPDIKEHPFPEYVRLGIPVCLSTDDRGMWDSNMTDEYFLAVTSFNLSWDELVEIGKNSLEFAFLPDREKEKLLDAYDRDITAFEMQFETGDWRSRVAEVRATISGYAERHLMQR
jgi:adenosine deaminase CECR1